MSPTKRILMVTPVATDNPYLACLLAGLRSAAPDLACTIRVGMPLRRWLPVWRRTDVIHLHWPEYVYTRPDGGADIRRGMALLASLAGAKALGRRIVYTIHNLEPHEGRSPLAHQRLQHLLLKLTDAVHVHDDQARQAITERFGRSARVSIIPHGSYRDYYPNRVTRAEARAQLGLDEATFVYLHLGQIRRYKGTLDLISAFGALAPADAVLLVAGKPVPEAFGAEVQALAAQTPKVQLTPGAVADDQLQWFFNAADICVLPYRRVTTSGAGALALSFGLPIVAPARGGFIDLVPGRGLLYDPQPSDGLQRSLAIARTLDFAVARAAALAWAEAHRWPAIAAQLADVYR